ncbi:polysaccharide biosynthesis/export family protein [Pseudooceanicola sp. HF7]|uniref:polysaccharide biosynthesis/export family protein n=1 Tax=Pseudooceanicola sp. HF7 TaxID=2721560 RepID=UPI0014315AE4|nr:polysaccharide biosynthesis/export family protein [Pseudooceanicola sp. HF7]NIZ10151.1 polysaccharide export protein [Pseudooceanicola sp. HF7]
MACLLSSCSTLPQVGPNKSQIFSGSVQEQGDAYVVPVDARIARITDTHQALGFSSSFRNAGVLGSDTIRAGDVLGLTIWENVDDGLLANEGLNATQLSSVQVDGDGFIFVPYAGRIRAAGNTPEAIRRIITEKLQEQTPDPQVEVRREAGDGATVTVIGAVGGQGVFPIQRPTRTLSAMIAAAGGIAIPPETAIVTVLRGSQRSQIRYEDIFKSASNDIAVRDGDRIMVQQDEREFTILGAIGSQSIKRFESPDLSAIEALAQAGGLRTITSDPTGIFVLRSESEGITSSVLGRAVSGPQKVIYLLNLTEPNGMFTARDFKIRDGDLIYVTEAPFTQWDKAVSALFGSLDSAAASVSTLSP